MICRKSFWGPRTFSGGAVHVDSAQWKQSLLPGKTPQVPDVQRASGESAPITTVVQPEDRPAHISFLSLLLEQVFYMWKKKKKSLQEVNDLAKKLLIKVGLSLQLQPLRTPGCVHLFHDLQSLYPLQSGELRGSCSHRPGPGEHVVPERRRQKGLEASLLHAEGLWNLLCPQGKDQGLCVLPPARSFNPVNCLQIWKKNMMLNIRIIKKDPKFGPSDFSFVLQSSSDLTCLVRFENINIYTTKNYKHKFKAPTNFCFVLKVNKQTNANKVKMWQLFVTSRWLLFSANFYQWIQRRCSAVVFNRNPL